VAEGAVHHRLWLKYGTSPVVAEGTVHHWLWLKGRYITG